MVKRSELKGDKRERSRSREGEKRRLEWISSNIRVLVRDSGRTDLYLKKVIVTDVLDGFSFQVRTSENLLVEDLREDQVQTLIPKRETAVLVLQGECQG